MCINTYSSICIYKQAIYFFIAYQHICFDKFARNVGKVLFKRTYIGLILVQEPHELPAFKAVVRDVLLPDPHPAVYAWPKERMAVLAVFPPHLRRKLEPVLHGNLAGNIHIPVCLFFIRGENSICLP